MYISYVHFLRSSVIFCVVTVPSEHILYAQNKRNKNFVMNLNKMLQFHNFRRKIINRIINSVSKNLTCAFLY